MRRCASSALALSAGVSEEFHMAEIVESAKSRLPERTSVWRELLRQEDWWAVWIGLGLIAVASLLFSSGGSIKWLAVAPQKWSHLSDVFAQLRQHGLRYGALFVMWAVLSGLARASLAIHCRSSWPAFSPSTWWQRRCIFLGFGIKRRTTTWSRPWWRWRSDCWFPIPSARRAGSYPRCASTSTSRPASFCSVRVCR